MDIFLRSIEILAYVVASASVVLNWVARKSKNTWDDALAAWWKKWPIKILKTASLYPKDPKQLPPA